MKELEGKVAIVAGGGRGIGRTCAEVLAENGAVVYIGSRTESEVADTVDHINASGGKAVGFPLDVTESASVNEFVARVIDASGKIDILNYVAGTNRRGPMAELTGACLDDPRLSLRLGDVGEAIRGAQECYDAILLDVDNGPDGLVRAGNDGLYGAAGIAAARRALKPGGLVAYWSAAPDPAFTKRLKASGLAVEEQMVRARSNGKGPRHTIWLASRSKTR